MFLAAPFLQLQKLLTYFAPNLTSSPYAPSSSRLVLFGGPTPWITPAHPWTQISDTLRNGSSHSTLNPLPNSSTSPPPYQILFSGHLDTQTLGGAGFTSYATDWNRTWDLSDYNGIEVEVVKGDGKLYTLILRDEGPVGKRQDGREKAGVGWQWSFKGEGISQEEEEDKEEDRENKEVQKIVARWKDFKAFYRGKEQKDAGKLRSEGIKRFSLMMRSYFEEQEGDFEVVLESISAVKI